MSFLCRPLTVIFFVQLLTSTSVRCEDKESKVISNCFIRAYSKIRCFGDFNVSNILFEQRQLVDPNATIWSQPHFTHLEIFNTTIEEIDENFLNFHDFKFETILIENATQLTSIHPKALVDLKDELKDFRAINTGLPQYNGFGNGPHKSENPFHDFKELREVYIGEQSRCPTDETLLFPCTCKFGELPRKVPSGLYGWSSGTSNAFGTTTEISCDNKDLTGDELKKMFRKVSESNHEPKHFDVLTLEGTKSLTDIPSDVFSNISITTIWMEDLDNLKSIHSKAFVSDTSDRVARSIQILDIDTANFTAASPSEVTDLFRALSSLTNIRILRLGQCGIPSIPSNAFTPENHGKQLNNLRYLSLSFDRRKHKTGIKSVGSYAFSGAPRLVELGIGKNFIEEFDSFAFAFNETLNRRLTIHIGGNPFNDTVGLRPNAFSGSQRPVRITFNVHSFEASDGANNPSLDFMPENVFRPFIEENAENFFEVDYFNVDVWCDCNSKWMFDDNGMLKPSVQNGLRIIRVMGNLVGSDPLSIQCKADSSFECLPNCLTFPSAGLIHCGGNERFDVKATFVGLGQSNGADGFSQLVFSSKEIQELPMDAFGSFKFDEINLADCSKLSSIHPNAFGASSETVKSFSAKNTNLTNYPNFASFPKLEMIRLDDNHAFQLNESNFDFSASTANPKEIHVFLSNGTIDPKTFSKLSNETAVTLHVGKRVDCSTLRCLLSCEAIPFTFDKETVKTFLEANPKNKIQTSCFLECSCNLKWMYDSWQDVGSHFDSWVQEYFGQIFYCVPKGANLETKENFFGIDVSQFKYGNYFEENC